MHTASGVLYTNDDGIDIRVPKRATKSLSYWKSGDKGHPSKETILDLNYEGTLGVDNNPIDQKGVSQWTFGTSGRNVAIIIIVLH